MIFRLNIYDNIFTYPDISSQYISFYIWKGKHKTLTLRHFIEAFIYNNMYIYTTNDIHKYKCKLRHSLAWGNVSLEHIHTWKCVEPLPWENSSKYVYTLMYKYADKWKHIEPLPWYILIWSICFDIEQKWRPLRDISSKYIPANEKPIDICHLGG